MTTYEKNFITALINANPNKEELFKKYDVNNIDELFLKSRMCWMKKYDNLDGTKINELFTERFNTLINNRLNDSIQTVITMRLVEGRKYQEIADKFGFTRSRAQQIMSNAIKKITRRNVIEVLLFDTEPSMPPSNIVEKYKPHNGCGNLIGIISSSKLSTRAINIICGLIIRYHNETNETFNEPEDLIPHLISPIMYDSVGAKTANEIIDFFAPYLDNDITNQWRDDIKNKVNLIKPFSRMSRSRCMQPDDITYRTVSGRYVKL